MNSPAAKAGEARLKKPPWRPAAEVDVPGAKTSPVNAKTEVAAFNSTPALAGVLVRYNLNEIQGGKTHRAMA